MFKPNNKKYLLIIIVLFALDQLTKFLVLQSGKIIDLGILKISEAHNTGASFGMLQGSNTILALISLVVIFAIGFYFKKIDESDKLPASIVYAGILGNLIDRISQGHVIDFIDFGWWPTFNFADTYIVLGIIWLMINTIKEVKNEKRTAKNKRKK